MKQQNNHSPFVQYLRNIWEGISTTVTGLTVTLRYFFRPKVTMEYPEVKPEIPEGYRGIHIYKEDKCTLCRACQAACPVNCITIEALGKGRDLFITRFDIDYSKCLFCDLCCEACKFECLDLGPDYNTVAVSRVGCILHGARKKSPEEIEAFQQKLDQKAVEKKAKQQAAKEKKAKQSSD